MKLLVLGDLHLRPTMPYSEYIADGREAEKQQVLNKLKELAEDCNSIVMLGDQFNARNNQSEVVREFTEFLASFGDKQVYILAGNHELSGDGKSAIDYIKEVGNPNWVVISNRIKTIGEMTFLPYFYKGELGVKSNDEAKKLIMKQLPKSGRFLFTHMTVSGMNFKGISTDQLPEIVLDRKELEKRFDHIINGHIHEFFSDGGKTINTGSIFTQEVGEVEKTAMILTVKKDGCDMKRVKLPCMPLVKLENPSVAQIKGLEESLVKVILTKKLKVKELADLKKSLKQKTKSYILIEQYPNERKAVPFDETMELTTENLLTVYAKQKKVNLEKLMAGFNLIKE